MGNTKELSFFDSRNLPKSVDKETGYIWLSILFYALWIHFTFNSYSSITVGNPTALSVSFNASTYSNGVALIALAVFYKHIESHLFDSGTIVASIFLCAGGTFLAMTSGFISIETSLIDFAAGIMSGLGSALLLLMIAYGAVAHRRYAHLLPISYIAAILLAVPLTFLPTIALLTLVSLFPAISAVFISLAHRTCKLKEHSEISQSIKPVIPLIVRVVIFLCVIYAVLSVVNIFAQRNSGTPELSVQFAASLVLFILFAVTSFVRKEGAGLSIYRITFLCLLVVLASAPFTGGDFSATYGLSTVLSNVTRAFIFYVELMFCVRTNLSPLLVFGLGEAVKKLPGLLIRVLTGGLGLDFFTSAESYMRVFVCLMLLVVIIYLFVLTESDVLKLTASTTTFAEAIQQENISEDIAKKFQLTERETEIFLQLCDGRSAPRIAQDLYISQSTVNVHIKNIYKKCDIHSRQELLDLVKK